MHTYKNVRSVLLSALVMGLGVVSTLEAKAAPTLTAKAVANVVSAVNGATFQFKERGPLFGYVDSESCLWASERVMIVQHYCGETNIPAKGVTVWSPDFGMIYIYQEQFPNVMRREIGILQFPESLTAYLSPDFRTYSVAQVSSIMEKLYKSYLPACWSTNYDPYEQAAHVGCVGTEISRYQPWSRETQRIVASAAEWANLWRLLEAKMRR